MNESLPQAVSMWRHPRRWGFIAFNLIAFAILVAWIVVTRQGTDSPEVFDLPYYALGYVGMAFLVVAWIAAWIAWIWMVVRRNRRQA